MLGAFATVLAAVSSPVIAVAMGTVPCMAPNRATLLLFSNHSRSEPRTNHFLPKLHLSHTESMEGHLFIDRSCGRQAVLQTVKAKGLVSLQD